MQGSKMAQVTYDSRCCFFHPPITFLANQKRAQAGRIYQSEASRVGLLLFETPTGFVLTKIGITLVHLSNCFSICFYFAYCKFWSCKMCVMMHAHVRPVLFHWLKDTVSSATWGRHCPYFWADRQGWALFHVFKARWDVAKNSILVSDLCSICYSLSSSMLQTQATTSLIDIWYFGWMTY